MSSKLDTTKRVGCLFLFALPFAAVGVVMAVLVVRSLLYWNEAQGWVETPCKIVAANLEENHDDEGGTTYRATARYQYEWAGKGYQSDGVSLHGGSDNIGSYQKQKAAELREYQRNGKWFRCYVNPNNPNEAVLYRDLRYGLLAFEAAFGLLFGGVGFGLIGAALWGRKRLKREEKLKTNRPEQPWLWRDDWQEGVVHSTRWGPAIGMGVMALFWNLISWMAAGAFFFGDKDMPAWAAAICLSFPLIGLGLIGHTVYLAMGASRWGSSKFEMASVPGVVGGRLAGVIHASTGLEEAESFLLTLTCVQKKTRRTSEGTETYEDPVWQADQEIVQTLGSDDTGTTVIPVSFHVPFDQHPTDDDAGYLWKLEAKAELPGVNYRAEFEVPVFKTADSSAEPPADDNLLAEYVVPRSFESAVKRVGEVVVSQTPNRCELLFPMARNISLALGITVFAVVWTGISVGLLFSDAPLLFCVVFPAFDLLILMMVVWFWLEKVTLCFGVDGVEVQGGILGLGKRRRYEREYIKTIVAEVSGTRSGNTVYQQVSLELQSGESRKLIGGIMRRSDATALAEEIRIMLGVADERDNQHQETDEADFVLEMPVSAQEGS